MFGRWTITAPTPEPDVRVDYGDDPFQFAELRLPKGHASKSSAFPVVIGVHGGYWMAQFSLDYFTHLCADLTAGGVATYCIEYRRLGNLNYPGFVGGSKRIPYRPVLQRLAPRDDVA